MKPTHYAMMNHAGSVFVKEAEFFKSQGGLTEDWGRNWVPVTAHSDHEARRKACIVLSQASFEAPETPDPMALGDDATAWAEAFVRTVNRRGFETSNLWNKDYIVGWFTNAIEATRSIYVVPDKETPLFKSGYDAGFADAKREEKRSSWQPWVHTLTIMQQSVLASAIRAPDGMRKHHPAKALVRWYRRSVLISAFDGKELLDPHAEGGGSFTGPIPSHLSLNNVLDDFMVARDEMSLHYYAHMMHAAQIVGCYHADDGVREFWDKAYHRMVNALHLSPETYMAMARRLSDDPTAWEERADEAASCTD